MLDFRRILFPVDFSERCKEVAPYVAGIARKFDSRIVALHVVDISLAGRPGPLACQDLLKPYEDSVRQTRNAELNQFALQAFDGLTVTRVLEVGDAAETITRYAEQNEIDLIVMPTHGLGTFRWLLLGSVTARFCTMPAVRSGLRSIPRHVFWLLQMKSIRLFVPSISTPSPFA